MRDVEEGAPRWTSHRQMPAVVVDRLSPMAPGRSGRPMVHRTPLSPAVLGQFKGYFVCHRSHPCQGLESQETFLFSLAQKQL